MTVREYREYKKTLRYTQSKKVSEEKYQLGRFFCLHKVNILYITLLTVQNGFLCILSKVAQTFLCNLRNWLTLHPPPGFHLNPMANNISETLWLEFGRGGTQWHTVPGNRTIGSPQENMRKYSNDLMFGC